MDDRTAGKAFLWGLIGGGIFMTLLVFGLALAAGLDPEVAAEVAPVPGVVAGLFFGTTVYLGVHLGKNEH